MLRVLALLGQALRRLDTGNRRGQVVTKKVTPHPGFHPALGRFKLNLGAPSLLPLHPLLASQ